MIDSRYYVTIDTSI